MGKTYKDVGVDIAAGVSAVSDISKLAKSTFSSNVLSSVGSFGAQYLFPMEEYVNPVLVSSTDGVGTKSLIAAEAGIYDTVGQDLVNHCVNDILTTGAKPLFMLDYIGVGKLISSDMTGIVSGLSKACMETGCSLIGGEMAEMPEIYGDAHYDLVGTIVGIVEKDSIIDGKNVKSGDVLIGLASNGLHTNGYTLARRVLLEDMSIDDYNPIIKTTVAEELLKIHRCYLNAIESLLEKKLITGMAHITGGGIEANISRIVSDELKLEIDWDAWDSNPIFELIQTTGEVPQEDMRMTFNMGIGFVIICRKSNIDIITALVKNEGESPKVIGKVI